MTDQMTLSQRKDGSFKTEKEKQIEKERQRKKEEYPEDYCLEQLRTELYLWDMRTWKNYKDREEINKWLDQIEEGVNNHKNCGHTAFCLDILLNLHNTDREKIIQAMLDNDEVKYKDASQEDKWERAIDYEVD